MNEIEDKKGHPREDKNVEQKENKETNRIRKRKSGNNNLDFMSSQDL